MAKKRVIGILAFVQHPVIELQPRKLAIDKALRACRQLLAVNILMDFNGINYRLWGMRLVHEDA
jgi:hypothetical protein